MVFSQATGVSTQDLYTKEASHDWIRQSPAEYLLNACLKLREGTTQTMIKGGSPYVVVLTVISATVEKTRSSKLMSSSE